MVPDGTTDPRTADPLRSTDGWHFSGDAVRFPLGERGFERVAYTDSDRWCRTRCMTGTPTAILRSCGRTANASSAVAGSWMITAGGAPSCPAPPPPPHPPPLPPHPPPPPPAHTIK